MSTPSTPVIIWVHAFTLPTLRTARGAVVTLLPHHWALAFYVPRSN